MKKKNKQHQLKRKGGTENYMKKKNKQHKQHQLKRKGGTENYKKKNCGQIKNFLLLTLKNLF